MNIMKFTLRSYGYKCNQPGNNSGQYVPLAEYQELRRLLERVDAIGEYLHDSILNTPYVDIPPESSQLVKLLSDIKEALK